jgi:hypothetical protein
VPRFLLLCLSLFLCTDSANLDLEQLIGEALVEAEHIRLFNFLAHRLLLQNILACSTTSSSTRSKALHTSDIRKGARQPGTQLLSFVAACSQQHRYPYHRLPQRARPSTRYMTNNLQPALGSRPLLPAPINLQRIIITTIIISSCC